MIIAAVTPVIIEYGRAVTSRQLAEAAGLAEGTIFRAFGDKESLITAVAAKHLDPEPFRAELRRIDVSLSLDDKVFTLVTLLRYRFEAVFHLMAALGEFSRPPEPDARRDFAFIIDRLLKPHERELAFEPVRIAQMIRSVTLAATLPQLSDGAPFDAAEITALLLHGISRPASASKRDT
ncbi:hypothetical protein ASC63_15715 [Leifsonia sp. Root112D2]|nr:hypothetical protein ASC63_15715 [Leifsonia sp. Root112D2]